MLDSLLRKGYFPQEIPKLFTTEVFADYIKNRNNNLPNIYTANKAKWAQQVDHNLLKVGGSRRRISVPNPINFYRLSNAFVNNKGSLYSQWDKSKFSKTKPHSIIGAHRAILTPHSDRSLARITARTGARYILKADISQFYPSLYTHAVPWAIHGKNVAKRNHSSELFGNVLDKELQASNFGQTKGIAIGPDTSLGIAELLLSEVDLKFKERTNVLAGTRFIDDMEFTFKTFQEAENGLAVLESLLFDFELQLNLNKTEIVDLPDNIESPYVSILRRLIPESKTNSRAQWIDYFNQSFELTKKYKKDGVLRYAIAACKYSVIEDRNWDIVQQLLWQAVTYDPGIIKNVIDILLYNIKDDFGLREIDKRLAGEVLNSIIVQSSNSGHHSEIFWALLSLILLKIDIPTTSIEKIIEIDDDFVALLTMTAKKNGLIEQDIESELWKSWIFKDSFYSEHWLFVYECYFNGWYSDKINQAEIGNIEECNLMREYGVTFIDSEFIPSYRPNQDYGELPFIYK